MEFVFRAEKAVLTRNTLRKFFCSGGMLSHSAPGAMRHLASRRQDNGGRVLAKLERVVRHRDSRLRRPAGITGAVLLLCSIVMGPLVHHYAHCADPGRSAVITVARTPHVTCGCARFHDAERTVAGGRSSRSVPFDSGSPERGAPECPSHDAQNCVICFILLQCGTVVLAPRVLPAGTIFETLFPVSVRSPVVTLCVAAARGPPPG